MNILVTNDDGIYANEMWTLVGELTKIGNVTVVGPDREQSAIGTAVTLHHPLRVRRITPVVPGIETHAVEGTPSDCILLALAKLLKQEIHVVVSGINQGLNLGSDVLISGTVGGALQGYLRGIPSLAISMSTNNNPNLLDTARVGALLTKKIGSRTVLKNIFLNVNVPVLSISEIKGIKPTFLARESHIETVEEGFDGKRAYYWLVRQRKNKESEVGSDMWAVDQGMISVTPLNAYLSGEVAPIYSDRLLTEKFCAEVLTELREGRKVDGTVRHV